VAVDETNGTTLVVETDRNSTFIALDTEMAFCKNKCHELYQKEY